MRAGFVSGWAGQGIELKLMEQRCVGVEYCDDIFVGAQGREHTMMYKGQTERKDTAIRRNRVC